MGEQSKNNNAKRDLVDSLKIARYLFNDMRKEKYGSVYIVLEIIVSIFDAIYPLIYILLPGFIINELIDLRRMDIIVLYVVLLVSAPLISHVKDFTLGAYVYKLNKELTRVFQQRFHAHVSTMDYELLEDPNVQILKDRIMYQAEAPVKMVNMINRIIGATFKIIAVSSIVISLNPLFAILLIAVMVINSFATKRINTANYLKQKKRSIALSRYHINIESLSYQGFGKELRIFDTAKFFLDKLMGLGKEIDLLDINHNRFARKYGTVHVVTSLVQQSVMYAYLVYNVLVKNLVIGTMTIFIATVGQFSQSLNQVFGIYLDFRRECLDIHDYIHFMGLSSLKNKNGDKKPIYTKESVIEFKNVSFKYPGSEKYALKNISVKIHGNEKLCLVGANGSGKSTFIKLLLGLYVPFEGEVLFNNIPIEQYDVMEYRHLFSPVFQDFGLYSLTFSQNITFSDAYDADKFDESIRKSNIESLVNSLPNGYNTYVHKDIDGEGFMPSGGEGQKMAIARALYRDASIFILDEPTAALDPIAEYEVYTKFNEMITDRGAILVTHRLSAVQLAQKVALFDSGKILDYGTHNDLYKKGGLYTEMFDKQAAFYIEGNQTDE